MTGPVRIDGTWLVEEVGRHTCGAGDHGLHEPGCGTMPIVDLSTLPGWSQLRAAIHDPLCQLWPERIDAALARLTRAAEHTFRHTPTGQLIEALGCDLAGRTASWWPATSVQPTGGAR